MPTERPPLVGEVVPTFADRGRCVVRATDPPVVSLGFLDRSRYSIKISSKYTTNFARLNEIGITNIKLNTSGICFLFLALLAFRL
jgi:hypothetical protein